MTPALCNRPQAWQNQQSCKRAKWGFLLKVQLQNLLVRGQDAKAKNPPTFLWQKLAGAADAHFFRIQLNFAEVQQMSFS